MKTIEEMTLKEIKELKEKYRDEFRELVYQFLKERPMIDYIWLYKSNHFYSLISSLGLSINETNVINGVYLKGEKK